MGYSIAGGQRGLGGYGPASGQRGVGGYGVAPAGAGLGFSLKPPSWLRNAANSFLQSVHLQVPTPVGPVSLTADEARNAIKGTKVSVEPVAQTPTEKALRAVNEVPGGIGTIGAVAVGALLLFLLLRKK